VFAISAGGTSLLTALHYPPPEAGIILAVGAFGFLACALFAVKFAERLERKLWLPIGAVITVIGSVLVAEAGTSSLVAFIGMAVVFFGFNVWVPMTYTLSAESFPTRARSTGFGLVDGLGHLGGGIGVLLIAPQIPHMSAWGVPGDRRVPGRRGGHRPVRAAHAEPAVRRAVPLAALIRHLRARRAARAAAATGARRRAVRAGDAWRSRRRASAATARPR
jgi:MFS family permease